MYASPASLCCPRMLLILLPPPIKLPASWENAMREQGRCGSPSPNPSRKKTKKRSWSDIMKLGKGYKLNKKLPTLRSSLFIQLLGLLLQRRGGQDA